MKAVTKLAKTMIKKDSSFVTIIYGEGITDEEAEEARSVIASKAGDNVEVTMVNGGQPIYYFILSVE